MAHSNRKQNFAIGAALLSTLGVLGLGQLALERALAAQEKVSRPRRSRSTPSGRSPSQPVGHRIDHRRYGRFAGSRVRHPSSGHLEPTDGSERRHQSADGPRVLRSRSSRPGVRSRGEPGRPLGRPGRGLRLAGVESRDHHRSHGPPVDRRQRAGRFPHPEVHPGWEVPEAVRTPRSETGQELVRAEPKFAGGSHDKESFGRVAKISFDSSGKEAFVADGYLNKRVAVLDGSTGEFKRYWGAYGKQPDDKRPRPLRPESSALAPVPESCSLRRAHRGRASRTSATARATASRSSA